MLAISIARHGSHDGPARMEPSNALSSSADRMVTARFIPPPRSQNRP